MLLYSHLGLAAVSKSPELALDEAEANAIAGAVANCLDVFDVRPDPRVEAVVGLVTTCGPIYATKYFLIRHRKNAERRAAPASAPAPDAAAHMSGDQSAPNGEAKDIRTGETDLNSLGLGGADYIGRA